VVHTTLAGLNLNFRFEPGTRGLDQQCGSNRVAGEYHFFLVRTRIFGLNHPKVVCTMRLVHTTLGWFRPLLLVRSSSKRSEPADWIKPLWDETDQQMWSEPAK
jgi:hypothetical protein